jgi:hypothetical protein
MKDTINIKEQIFNSSFALNSLWLWLGFGIFLILIGLYIYASRIIPLKRKELIDKGFIKNLEYYIAYVPSDDSKAWHHIVAGVCTSIGICLVIGVGIAALIVCQDHDGMDFHHVIFESSGLVFAIFISGISFWTLWQTKKIEHLQGFNVSDLSALLKHLNKEIKRIIDDYNSKNNKRALDYHRFFLITSNPFLGLLSYPNDEDTQNFLGSLESLKTIKVIEQSNKNTDKFRIEIVCVDEEHMKIFHTEFYSNREKKQNNNGKKKNNDLSDEVKEKIQKANSITENLLKEYNGHNIITRVKEVPKFPQFAIVGNKVFEFTLEARSPFTEVTETHIVVDRKRADMYEKTFYLLKNTLSKL